MSTIYNILSFNFSHTLSRKQFFYYNIIPIFAIIFLSLPNSILPVLFLPSFLIFLFLFSLFSLYRLNDAGVKKAVSFILILIFILLISAYLAITIPTPAYNNEWSNDVSKEIYKLAVYKRDLIFMIYYIYAVLFVMLLFIMPSSKNKNINIIRRRYKSKVLRKLQYIYTAYLLNPLFKCFKFKKNYKMSSKTFFYFWILLSISIILYFIITTFYAVSLSFLRDIISSFTGGEFENKDLGFGMVILLSLAINTMVFLVILLIIFVSSAKYRLYDVFRIKNSYINSILIAYGITAAYILFNIYSYAASAGNGKGYYYFLLFHAILLLILTLLPSKKH